MTPYFFAIHGVTEGNLADVTREIGKIGKLITAPGITMAIIVAADETSANQLLNSALGSLNLTFVKAHSS